MLGFGVTGVALVQYFYFVAIDRLPVGIALLIEFTAPVLVALFARFVYGEQVRRRMWLGIACSLGGLALVAEVWDGLTLDTVGVLAAFAAAVSLATYFLHRRAQRQRRPTAARSDQGVRCRSDPLERSLLP